MGKPATAGSNRRAERLTGEARKTLILEGAARFFSERGFSAQIADLAAALQISESLVFKYFGTKATLIDEVEYHLFKTGWPVEWRDRLSDRSVPLQQRIEQFYVQQLERFSRPEWIRIGLMILLGGDVQPKTLMVRGEVFSSLETILRELRVSIGLDAENELTEEEWELAWHLHSSFLFILIRRNVMGLPTMDPAATVRRLVRNFLAEFEGFHTPAS